MHENTFELIPLKAILTKKIVSNETEKSKEWMELPNGWKFLCCTLSRSIWRRENMGYCYF